MNAFCRIKLVAVLFMSCAALFPFRAQGGTFSLEIVKPATQIGDIGTLRVVYEDGDDNYSFYNGGLHLKLSSSAPGVIKFLDAEIANDDGRWTLGVADLITDDQIGRMFAASIMTPGLVGTAPRTFAEVRYSLAGPGATELMVDVGGEDPVVEGPLGEISTHVSSRSLCLGDCLPDTPITEINLGESWARLKEQMYPTPAPYQPPVQPVPVDPLPGDPVSVDPVPTDPSGHPEVGDPVSDESDPSGVTPIDDIVVPMPDPGVITTPLIYLRDPVAIGWLTYPVLFPIDVSVLRTDLTQFSIVEGALLFTRNGQLNDGVDEIQLASTFGIGNLVDTAAFDGMPAAAFMDVDSFLAVPEINTLVLAVLFSVGIVPGRRSRR